MWVIRRIVSKGDYNYALIPEHPNATKRGYVLEHRIVIENHIKRLLSAKEVVHHIDGNKKNNTLSNLIVMLAPAHAKLHHSTGRTYCKFSCPECRGVFVKERRKVLGKSAFCSRNCNGKFQKKKQLFGLTAEMKLAMAENIIEVFKKPL